MEQIANLHIEKLPEGVYLATSDDIPGLIAQGRTITETIEIARDVATKLLEALEDIRLYDSAKESNEPSIPVDIAFKNIEAKRKSRQ